MNYMVSLKNIIEALDSEFSFFKGEDDSCNGLQVEGKEEVSKVAVTCDASLETIEKAISEKAEFIFCHHGLFWKKALPEKVHLVWRKRLKILLKNDVSLYAVHLPLDAHPTMGNNALLANMLGLKNLEPAGEYNCSKIGFKGVKECSLEELAKEVKNKLGEARVFKFHDNCKNIAVGSGGCGFVAHNAFSENVDTLVTGEFKHSDYHLAKENNCNVIEAGHYNTEVLGVREIGKWLEKKFALPFVFMEAPTGL